MILMNNLDCFLLNVHKYFSDLICKREYNFTPKKKAHWWSTL